MGHPIHPLLAEWEEDAVVRLGRDRYSAAKQNRMVQAFLHTMEIESLEQIRPRAVIDWLGRMGREGRAHQTQANALAALRSFVRWAVETERMPANAVDPVRIARRVDTGEGAMPFTADEVRALVSRAFADMDSPNRRLSKGADARAVLYATLALTGLRIGEAARQRWADIDLLRGTLTVTRDKARRRDRIPLCGQAVEILGWWRQRADGPVVFPSLPTHRTLERDMARCGIESSKGQWHRFRKTSITLRAEAGVGIWELTRLARHADPKMTLRYIVTDPKLSEAAATMPKLVPTDSGPRCG